MIRKADAPALELAGGFCFFGGASPLTITVGAPQIEIGIAIGIEKN